MKKWLFRIFFFIIFLAVSSALIVYVNRVKFLTAALSQAMNVTVEIEAIDIAKNGAVIRGLKMKNPPGCTLQHALTVHRIDILLDWMKLMQALVSFKKSKIVIDSITADSLLMGIELFTTTGSVSNWSRIVEAVSQPSDTPSSIEVMIKKLVMTNIKLEVKYHNFVRATLNPAPIKRIELKNIGGEENVGMKQLFLIISKVLLNQAASTLNLKMLIPEFFLQRFIPIPLFQVEEAGQLIKKLFDKNKKEPSR